MSKKLIQTKLSFSSSQPEPVNDEVTKPFLKRKLSDSAVEEDMSEPGKSRLILSYADAVDGSSAQSNKYVKFHENIESSSGSIQENAGASSNLQRSTSWTLIDSLPDEAFPHDSSDYTDDTHNYNRIEKDKPNTSHDSDPCWKGVPLSELKKAPECFKSRYKKLSPGPGHIVFFDVLNKGWENEDLKPFRRQQNDTWNNDYVYMPNHERNQMLENGEMYYSWDKICVALSKNIPGTLELQRTILSYNPHYRRKWSFEGLHLYFEQNKESSKMKDEFFVTILPKMQDLALRLPELCPMAIPILKQRRNMKITFSQEQIACLLANAFFCTFPKRNFKPKNSPLPDINFSNLYSESQCSRKFEKFKCIINYFKRVTTTMPTGAVTYARQYEIPDNTFWNTTDKKFTNLHVSTSGTIEDDGRGMLQADFANKYVGGGVLGHGLVQEEIRFLICPEMILSRLFTEVLTDNEVLIMTGCERFSNYEGYSESFKFSGDHQDTTESDVWKRKCTEVVAMDALVVRGDKRLSSIRRK
uniref:poly(ADP-ribose) glycohydrolase n=1 Tax=Arion vulgaris TaxID=1028688 RepID=A0A0B7B403_9EUPU